MLFTKKPPIFTDKKGIGSQDKFRVSSGRSNAEITEVISRIFAKKKFVLDINYGFNCKQR